MLRSLRYFNESEAAQQRLKILEFYERYGEEATQEAFGVNRKQRFRRRLECWDFDVSPAMVNWASVAVSSRIGNP